jgi:hypothetical protein
MYFEPLSTVLSVVRRAVQHKAPSSADPLDMIEAHTPVLGYADLRDILVASEAVFTAGANPLAVTIAGRLLAFGVRELFVLENADKQDQTEALWRDVVRSYPNTRVNFAFGDLADKHWLSSALSSRRRKIVVDLASHRYVLSRLPVADHSRLTIQRAAKAFEQAELVDNVVRCSVGEPTVESLLLVLPHHPQQRVRDRISLLYANVLCDEATVVGTIAEDDVATVTVWSANQHDVGSRRLTR